MIGRATSSDESLATSFQTSHRRLERFADPGHRYFRPSLAWIELHRMVEAFCRSAATPFHVVFADLERRFQFGRGEPSRWPDAPTMRRAAADLALRRANLLAVRAGLIAGQRERKRRGLRTAVPAVLREEEDGLREYHRSVPAVGCWGWRRLRDVERRRSEK